MPLDAPPSGALDQTAHGTRPAGERDGAAGGGGGGLSSSNGRSADDPGASAPASNRRWWQWFPKPYYSQHAIRDMRFIQQLAQLKSLKTFLLTEGGVTIRPEDTTLFNLGTLNQLQYSELGRLPTVEEWDLLDTRSQKLGSYLDDALRSRFQLRQTANLIAWLPVVFIVFALFSLVYATVASDRPTLLLAYLFWTICLGGLGAIAFLSVNALSIQTDVTFDLADKSLLAVRIVLGSFLGLVLSIPFGFDSFVAFCELIGRAAPDPGASNTIVSVRLQAALLLLPFIVGFSTSLVILILKRFVESIAVFFGDRR